MISDLHASFTARDGATGLARLREAGALRLRRSRGPACEAILVNVGGGVVAGDRQRLSFDLGVGTSVQLTTSAAEKIYGSDGPCGDIETRLTLADQAELHWLPQETILFDTARLTRRVEISLAPGARLLAVETLIFGRLAMGETSVTGLFRDSWRVRRDGRPIYAEETRLAGDIGRILDRPALAAGARATSLLLFTGDALDARVAELARVDADPEVIRGFSHRDEILIGRYLAASPARLRHIVGTHIAILTGRPLPRAWG